MPINLEFVGGPADGCQGSFGDDDLDLWGGLPDRVRAIDGASRFEGTYVATRKITRRGRLIYEYRQALPTWRASGP